MSTELGAYLVGHANYWLFVFLMMTGLYIIVAKGNLVKKVIGLNMFQAAVIMLYVSMGKVAGGTAPIFPLKMKIDPEVVYSNPLPHVLMLTAIVVGVATTALALALIVRIREEFDTIEEADIQQAESAMALREQRLYGEAMGSPE